MKFRIEVLLLALATLIFCNGCLLLVVGGAAAAGAGTVVYVNGELKDSEAVSIQKAHAATLAAFKDLQFGVVGDVTKADTTTVSARTSSDKKVQVTLVKESATVTQIKVRVDVFGDESLSHQVLDKIKARLK